MTSDLSEAHGDALLVEHKPAPGSDEDDRAELHVVALSTMTMNPYSHSLLSRALLVDPPLRRIRRVDGQAETRTVLRARV